MMVVAAIIRRDGRFLITKRKHNSKHEPARWEFPGGKVEAGESPQESLRREIMEELGVRIEVGPLFATVMSRDLQLIAFTAELVEGEPRAIDVADFAWADLEEFGKFDWSKADIPIVEKIISSGPERP